jgi:hypothetical protein
MVRAEIALLHPEKGFILFHKEICNVTEYICMLCTMSPFTFTEFVMGLVSVKKIRSLYNRLNE